MKRLAEIVENGRVIGLVHGADATNQEIVVNGRTWRFDFDEWCGPLWLTKAGQARKCQCPNKKVWDAFDVWMKEYSKDGTLPH